METAKKHHYPEEEFVKAKPWRPCPICGKGDWCGFNSFIASCMRIEEGSFKTVIQMNGKPAYLHWLEPGRVTLPVITESEMLLAVQTASVERRDRVYRDFLNLLYLHPRHMEDLTRRGLTEEEIKKNYRSIPETEMPWTICKYLIELGHDLTGIPGFYKAKGWHGGTYWTFDRQPGYFIPVRDQKGRIQALQRRMDDPRGGKYKLFSGHKNQGGCSCGTPAHVAIPTEIKDFRVWITEGPLKADIASKYLGAVVIGASSADTWRPAIEILESKFPNQEIVEAFDQDKHTNSHVKMACENFRRALTKAGKRVVEARWNIERYKGLDDAALGRYRFDWKRIN